MFRVIFVLGCLMMLNLQINAGIKHLLPTPQKVETNDMLFPLNEIQISTPVMEEEWLSFFNEMEVKSNEDASLRLKVEIESAMDGIPSEHYDEGYKLKVTDSEILVKATGRHGVFNAMQTLRQLKTEQQGIYYFEGCRITDYPAFRIRGFMHDVGRSYIPAEELKTQIALLSQYKINVFHWHFTENQAWRLESKIFPELNDSINMTRFPGKYYTHKEVLDLVEFAARHHVMVIPEIDMPGHSAAFERTFNCGMQSAKGMDILKQLIAEACELFDVPYLHIGTDEVEFTNPRFVPGMVAFIRSKGKKVISWNPGWHYEPGEIDMTQLWSYRGKIQEGIPAIDSRFHYLNHFDGFADLFGLFSSKIGDRETGSENVTGAILALWNDRKLPTVNDILAQNSFYPNMLVLAERAWQGGGHQYFDEFGTSLPKSSHEAFNDFREFENTLLYHKYKHFESLPFPYVRQTDVEWQITDAFPNKGDLSKKFPPEEQLKEKYNYQGKTYQTQMARGAGIYLRHVWGNLVPGFFENPKPNSTAYAWTWVYSPKSQKVGLWAEFQNYSRSEADLPPPQEQWDYKGSKIFINDKEILPPVWNTQHTERSHEISLGNENFTARPPIIVNLNKGWNKVFLKLPVGSFSTPEIRLVKWMFTVAFVTPNGKKRPEGIRYSASEEKPD